MRSVDLFALHSRSWHHNRYVYPVISRRSGGLSIGINLNPDGVCNFDCIYCCVERTAHMPSGEVELPILRSELVAMLEEVRTGRLFAEHPFSHTPAHLRELKDVAFSGNGEPTACRCFEQACEVVTETVKAYRRKVGMGGAGGPKIVLITNATLLRRPTVTQGLNLLDHAGGEVWAKLDAGTEQYYGEVNRSAVPLKHVLENIAAAGRARPIVIQTMFCRIHDAPPDRTEIVAYVARLMALKGLGCDIKSVQVYTTARQTAEENVTPLLDTEVDGIVESVRLAGIPAQGYYGVS